MLERPPLLDKQYITQAWAEWFSRLWDVSKKINQSGTTANRPINGLSVGDYYFDTDLGHPIWLKSHAAGVSDWVDGAGTSV